MQNYLQSIQTPVGKLFILSDQKYILAVAFEKNWKKLKVKFDYIEKESSLLIEAKKQLNEYFSGSRKNFSLPCKLIGTDFQIKAWNALKKIKYGTVSNYKKQALVVGAPNACRAVGTANSMNHFCIIIPCHRVIASNGKISGYAGGTKVKEFLLRLENAI